VIRFRVGDAASKSQWSIITVPAAELIGDDDSLANIDPDQRIVFVRPSLTGSQLGYVLCTVASMNETSEV
jgi:hypothetical protein